MIHTFGDILQTIYYTNVQVMQFWIQQGWFLELEMKEGNFIMKGLRYK